MTNNNQEKKVTIKRIECEGVGDNNGYFEMEISSQPSSVPDPFGEFLESQGVKVVDVTSSVPMEKDCERCGGSGECQHASHFISTTDSHSCEDTCEECNGTGKVLSPSTPEVSWESEFDNLPEEKLPGYGAHFMPTSKTIKDFIKSVEQKAYERGCNESMEHATEIHYERGVSEERKRVNDILDGMKKELEFDVSELGSVIGTPYLLKIEALEQAKHLINNTQ